MDNIIGQLKLLIDTESSKTMENIITDLLEFKENIIVELQKLDPVNGLYDIMEDIEILIDKINGEEDW